MSNDVVIRSHKIALKLITILRRTRTLVYYLTDFKVFGFLSRLVNVIFRFEES